MTRTSKTAAPDLIGRLLRRDPEEAIVRADDLRAARRRSSRLRVLVSAVAFLGIVGLIWVLTYQTMIAMAASAF